jgi:hypothetical protein
MLGASRWRRRVEEHGLPYTVGGFDTVSRV